MLAVEITLLTGRYVATAFNDRRAAEWPPHPARLYSALVAVTPGDDDPAAEGALAPAETDAALTWLEAQPAPSLAVSAAARRAVVETFVPVNDVHIVNLTNEQLDALVEARGRVAAALPQGDDDKAAAKARKAAEKEQKAAQKALEQAQQAVARALAPMTPGKGDAKSLKMASDRFDAAGSRKARSFPSVCPVEPTVTFIWPHAQPSPAQRASLAGLLARLQRLGHSSSLVSARMVEAAPAPTLAPHPEGDETLRVAAPGQLAALRAQHAVHQETEPRVLPADFVRYGPPAPPEAAPTAHSLWGQDWLVLRRIGGPRLPLSAAPAAAARLRAALLAAAIDPRAPSLSGHHADGAPLGAPHLAVVALPFVGAEHADGQLRGFALVMPRAFTEADRLPVLAALGAWEARARDDGEEAPTLELHFGQAGTMELERVVDQAPLQALRPGRWCRPSAHWVTVTPIALDRNPGRLGHPNPVTADKAALTAAETVAKACVFAGLPRPVSVEISGQSPIVGGSPARAFGPWPQGPRGAHGSQRVLVHARLQFAAPVSGPLLLGAGRHFGLGLCAPVNDSTLNLRQV